MFYPRRVWEVADTHVRLVAFYLFLHRIRKKVERDKLPYVDFRSRCARGGNASGSGSPQAGTRCRLVLERHPPLGRVCTHLNRAGDPWRAKTRSLFGTEPQRSSITASANYELK